MDIANALAQLLDGHDVVITISARARSGAPAQDRPTADTSPTPTIKKSSKKKAAPKVEPEALADDGGDDWGSMFGPST
jgi:hypothetical protein